jgi:putative NADH-flavin reductase
MKITIFGSTGKTGQILVRKALEHGHGVIAFARTPNKLAVEHQELHIVQGDIREGKQVAQAISGADGVINAVGPTPDSPPDLLEQAAKNIASAMKQNGVRRLIWSTGAAVRAPQDEPTLMQKSIEFLLKLISPKVLENSLKGAEIIQNSGLDWTIARAPMLTDEPGSGGYHAGFVGSQLGRTLSRENFAEFMLDLVEGDDWLQEMPAASDL